MKPIVLAVFILACANVPSLPPLTVWMIGDSTMAIKADNKFPETGWGVPFAKLFSDHVNVCNWAKNGRSTKSFRTEGLWDSVYLHLKPNDYVFIQFGHNDEKIDKPTIGTSISEFEENLKAYVQAVIYKKAFPILLTPIVRRKYEDNMLVDTHGFYGKAALRVAQDMNVPIIDLNSLSKDRVERSGEQGSKSLFLHLEPGHPNYPNGVQDDTHLNAYGAASIAQIVATALKEQNMELSKYLK